ncbi:AraC family transcriptional regulator [Agrobacterium sp. ES01]|uniref:AraC family transcriptional regulator n=1 Tax=Agrobacterium sp. ES01 TaxID=3420714 RepID=UPI003D12A05D
MSIARDIAEMIAQHAAKDGIHATSIPRLSLVRMSKRTEPVHTVQTPSICMIVQGRKQLMLCEQVIDYGPGKHIVISVDVPIIGQIIEATDDAPYLCLRLDLDLSVLSELVLAMDWTTTEISSTGCKAIGIGETSEELLGAAHRLVSLLDAPDDAPFLAPIIEREILYRLLKSEHAGLLRQILTPNNRLQNVNRAISWIKENFQKPLLIEHLAGEARMSASSLHEHFRQVTNMSPLQYQKQLRLQEARRLIFAHGMDAATAGRRVGYDSPSQFSREYRRQFGAPPLQDIGRLRVQPERYTEA